MWSSAESECRAVRRFSHFREARNTLFMATDGKEQMVKPIAEDFHDMSRPVWTRRWSAWIEPSWKQKSSMSPSMTTTRHPDEVEERSRVAVSEHIHIHFIYYPLIRCIHPIILL